MKAMILAAGRGARMRPLTDTVPKPLLEVIGKPLIVHCIENLRGVGIQDIVINLGYRGDQIHRALGDGRAWGVRITYSREPEVALETGGGILQALPLLGKQPFMVINSDIWSDYPLTKLPADPNGLAHLVLVDNPPHHPNGDFALDHQRVILHGTSMLTFSGISVLRPELFADCRTGRFPLVKLLYSAIHRHQVSGEHYRGSWCDIGTPQRLAELRAALL